MDERQHNLSPLIVEVPFDPDYLTEAGQYIAGYTWGKHIRSAKEFETPGHARGDWVELYPRFVQGVRDGLGDGMRKNEDAILAQKSEVESLRKKFETKRAYMSALQCDELYNQYAT